MSDRQRNADIHCTANVMDSLNIPEQTGDMTGHRVMEILNKTQQIHDTNCVWCGGTGWRGSRPRQWYESNPEVVTTMFPCDCDKPCPTCGGKGYIEMENAHEMEVWACPKCRPGIVGEIV